MTKRESAIIGAYTGILCGPFDALHGYIKEILERPVLTHELTSKTVFAEIKEKSTKDFMELAASVTD